MGWGGWSRAECWGETVEAGCCGHPGEGALEY